MARQVAGIFGVIILLLGVAGLVLGGPRLLGAFNIELVEDIVHIVTGGILAFVGFGQRDEGVARNVLGGLGVVYLLVGVIGFIIPNLFGLLPEAGYTVADNLLHLALGVIFIAVAYLMRSETRETVVTR